MRRGRAIITILATLLCVVLVVETGGHIIYRLRGGEWLWNIRADTEVFGVGSFMDYTDDERIVTNKKSVTEPTQGFIFDENRFRMGRQVYGTEKKNIVFLGDSVPFGWGIKNNVSLPSMFYLVLMFNGYTTYGVINAAIPSYGLHQSVYRYAYELHEKEWPVAIVILQVLDPATQLSRWGALWNREMNWATNGKSIFERRVQEMTWHPTYRYSSVMHTLLMARLLKETGNVAAMDIDDTKLKERFMEENNKDLATLLSMVRDDGGVLILLPANPAASYKEAMAAGTDDAITHAFAWMNEGFRAFAEQHEDAYFFDVVDYFDLLGRSDAFVDDCCHLSATGSLMQADFLMESLKDAGLVAK